MAAACHHFLQTRRRVRRRAPAHPVLTAFAEVVPDPPAARAQALQLERGGLVEALGCLLREEHLYASAEPLAAETLRLARGGVTAWARTRAPASVRADLWSSDR